MQRAGKRWIKSEVVIDIETNKVLSERGGHWYEGPIESCDPGTIALISLIASLGFGGTELGLNLANRPSAPKAPGPTPGVTALQNTATQNAEKAAIGQQVPNILASTSGLANPEYTSQIAQLLAGTAGASGSSGAAKSAVAKAFGLPEDTTGSSGGQATSTSNFKPAGVGGSPTGGAGEPVALSDFVSQFLYR